MRDYALIDEAGQSTYIGDLPTREIIECLSMPLFVVEPGLTLTSIYQRLSLELFIRSIGETSGTIPP